MVVVVLTGTTRDSMGLRITRCASGRWHGNPGSNPGHLDLVEPAWRGVVGVGAKALSDKHPSNGLRIMGLGIFSNRG